MLTSNNMECVTCAKTFASQAQYQRHLGSKGHQKMVDGRSGYFCVCGKEFQYRQGLWRHKKNCRMTMEGMREANEIQNSHVKLLEKQNEELRKQVEELLVSHSTVTNNNTTNNTTTIENQNNTINIHINAFGQENLDYIKGGIVMSCINRVFKSIPAILEHIHFDPDHPENHNIKITNKKLPYASVMGDNNQWKTVNKKDAIETMVNNGYNYLDEKYGDYKDGLSTRRQDHFESFQTRYTEEDKELLKQLKNDVELLVLNGPHNPNTTV